MNIALFRRLEECLAAACREFRPFLGGRGLRHNTSARRYRREPPHPCPDRLPLRGLGRSVACGKVDTLSIVIKSGNTNTVSWPQQERRATTMADEEQQLRRQRLRR